MPGRSFRRRRRHARWPPDRPAANDAGRSENDYHESWRTIKVTPDDQFRFIHRYTHAPIIRTPPDRVAPSRRSPAFGPRPRESPTSCCHPASRLPPAQSAYCTPANACHARGEDMPRQTSFLRFDVPKELDKNGLTTSQECGEDMNEFASEERRLKPPLRSARRGA